MKDFRFELDSGETINVSRNLLIHVEKTVMDRVRPSRFREILKIDSSVPDWVQEFGYDKITETAQWLPAEEFTEDFATPSVKVDTESFKLFELASGYRYGVREMVRAQKMGMNLDASRAAALMKKGETMLDFIAADGTLDGTKALHPSVKGLYNTSGATVLTPDEFSGNTTSWKDQLIAAFLTGQDAYDAVCDAIVDDILAGEDKGESVTKETTPPDTVVLPLSQKSIMRRTKSRSDKTLEQHVYDRAKYLKRIMYWAKPDSYNYGADGTHKRRVVWLTASDEDAARFVLPKAATPGRPYQLMNGVFVPMNMVVGGFNTKMAETIIYADLKDDA